MNPSPASDGGISSFEWWSNIWLPLLGILVTVCVPIAVLYIQRHVDERARALREKRQALSDLVLALAPFVSVNPRNTDMRLMLVELRLKAMQLIDMCEKGDPLTSLVMWYHQWGMMEGQLAIEEVCQPRYAHAHADAEEMVLALSELRRWAMSYTNDLRLCMRDDPDPAKLEQQARDVESVARSRMKKLGMDEMPDPLRWAEPSS